MSKIIGCELVAQADLPLNFYAGVATLSNRLKSIKSLMWSMVMERLLRDPMFLDQSSFNQIES